MDKSESHVNWSETMLFDRLVEVVELLGIARDPEAPRTQQLVHEKNCIDFEIAQRTGAVLLPRVVETA